jgi:hypothetical protein
MKLLALSPYRPVASIKEHPENRFLIFTKSQRVFQVQMT